MQFTGTLLKLALVLPFFSVAIAAPVGIDAVKAQKRDVIDDPLPGWGLSLPVDVPINVLASEDNTAGDLVNGIVKLVPELPSGSLTARDLIPIDSGLVKETLDATKDTVKVAEETLTITDTLVNHV